MIFRGICFLIGAGILGLTVNATIAVSGGYTVPQNLVLVGVAAGLAIGAIAVGKAWAHKQRWIALGLVVCLFAGEVLILIMTAERVSIAQEMAQAPARERVAQRNAAEKRVQDAMDAMKALETSSRLEAAKAAKAAADKAVVEQAPLRGCRRNCRALLEQQVETAVAEVKAARQALHTRRARLETDLAQAKTALTAIPLPPSATPLADRLGVEQFIIDLARAFATSLAANGLACFLIALAGHHSSRPAEPPPPEATKPKRPKRAVEVRTEPDATETAMDQVDRFAGIAFQMSANGSIRVVEALRIYREWCARNGEKELTESEFAEAFATLVETSGLTVTDPADPRINGISFAKLIEAA